MMSTSTQSPRLGFPVGSGSSAVPTLWDAGDTACAGGLPRLGDGAGGGRAGGSQADPIDLTSTGDGGGLGQVRGVDELLDQLSSAPRDAHCLAMLDKLASLGGLTLKQQVRLVGLYRQVSTACDGKAADLSARLFECHGKTEGDRRALVDWIARATSSTHGDAARLTQVGQARQATPELKQSMDLGGTSLQGAAALVGETKNLSSQAASQVIGTVIGQGPGRNPAELRQAARVQVEQAHQDTAVERHAKAMRQRHVSVTPAADGMSWLRAYVASTDATVVSSALARQARSQPAAGRSLANVEADLLVDYLHQAIDQADQTGRTSKGKPVDQASHGDQSSQGDRTSRGDQASQAKPAGQASQVGQISPVEPAAQVFRTLPVEAASQTVPTSRTLPVSQTLSAVSPQPGVTVSRAQPGETADPVDLAAASVAAPIEVRPAVRQRATARNARLLVMVDADVLDATEAAAGTVIGSPPRADPAFGPVAPGRLTSTSTSRLLVKIGPAQLDPAHPPGPGPGPRPPGADPVRLESEIRTGDSGPPVGKGPASPDRADPPGLGDGEVSSGFAVPPDGKRLANSPGNQQLASHPSPGAMAGPSGGPAASSSTGLMVGSGSVVTGPDLDGLVALAHRQAMVIDSASGRLVALGPRPSRPGGKLIPPKVTWNWKDPATWPAERAWSDSRLPSGWLALMLMIRDQTCRWPGCIVPATDCQFDHLEPFSLFRESRAQTWAGNLVCVCLMHHRLRHDQDWTGRRDPTTGQTIWTGPHGQTLTKPPERFD